MGTESNAPDDFTPADFVRHLQSRDAAVHDQISAAREDADTSLALAAEAESRAHTVEEKLSALSDQVRALTLEQLRTRALVEVNLEQNQS